MHCRDEHRQAASPTPQQSKHKLTADSYFGSQRQIGQAQVVTPPASESGNPRLLRDASAQQLRPPQWSASPSRSNNNSSNGFVTLPRISGGGFPAARSLGKVELMAARRGEHPLYRTTTGFDYGRYLDIDGGSGALSCPKHAKIAGFTREFIAGSYCDSSLQSIDKRYAEVS